MSQFTDYPGGGDLRAFLSAAGLTLSGELEAQAETAAAAARREVERAAGRVFLAAAGTRTFDPPTNVSGLLSFRADLASLTSVTVGGVAYAEGTEYRAVREANDPARPLLGLRFRRRWTAPLAFSELDSVSVTGSWGYAATLPEEVWQAILAQGACLLWPQVAQGETGGVQSWQQGDTQISYETGFGETRVQGWQDQVSAVVSAYRCWRP